MLKYTQAEKQARAERHEAAIWEGMRRWLSLSAIGRDIGCDLRVLLEDFACLGIDAQAYRRTRALKVAEAGGETALARARERQEERQSPIGGSEAHRAALAAKRACAEHFADLVKAYPGLKLKSLDIPEGYGGYRPFILPSAPLSASVAARCAELGG